MRKLSCLLGLFGLGWLLYCLFQPIVDWHFGWNKLPESVFNQHFEGAYDNTYAEPIAKSKAVLLEAHHKSQAPSLSIAVAIGGNTVWSYSSGFENIEELVPADTSTRYRIGSVSKAITSLGLARLLQTNTISLDSSIQYYTGMFSEKPKITVKQLASHQSGIRNYRARLSFPIWEYYRNEEFASVEESISDFENDDLLFEPGEDFAYSTYNYTALSYAMESVSGVDYLTIMNQEVFIPLKMQSTQADKKNSSISNRAVPYFSNEKLYKPALDVNLSNKWAGGGLLSTPSDLVRAGNALLDSAFISSKVIQIITTPQRLNNGDINNQNYALGWRHDYSDRYLDGAKKVEIIHHGGMAVGGLALLAIYPEYNMTVALTVNKSGQEGRFELFDYAVPIANLFITELKEINRSTILLH
ncbi:serine hydrolase domain-containing protein [Ekhidna sp.]|uniref:serine hydrolase domain-containing protein n=1 Tax=Ekhidna sp. TaxID=2608089 RepID=UPI0035150448